MSRISPGTIIVGIFAVLFGLVGAYVVRQSLQRPPAAEAEAPQRPRPTTVPMAAMDLEADRPITLGDIAVSSMTNEQLRERKLGGFMVNTQQIIGRALREPMKKGDTFKPDMFYADGTGPNLAERLEPGLRAVTVPIAQDVVGFVSPGTMVDVIFRTSTETGAELPETTVTLLENVRVLALGRSTVPGATPPPSSRLTTTSVTLAVAPEQASALKIVEGRGDLMLTLRSPDDGTFAEDGEPHTLEGLLGWAGPPQPLTTDVYRGNTKATVEFEPTQQAPKQYGLSSLPVRRRITRIPTAAPNAPTAPSTVPQETAPSEVIPPKPEPEEPAKADTTDVPLKPDAGQTSGLAPATPPPARPDAPPMDVEPANQIAAQPVVIAPALVAKSDSNRSPAIVPKGRFSTQRFDGTQPSEVAFKDGQRVIEAAPAAETQPVNEVDGAAPEFPPSLMNRPPAEQPSVLFTKAGGSSRRSASKIIIPVPSDTPAGP